MRIGDGKAVNTQQLEKGVAMIRVMIVDDHALVRAGLSAVLHDTEGILVVGECCDGVDVRRVALSLRPDVVLMDIKMPVMSGTDATRALLATNPMIRVIMLTGSRTERYVAESLNAGAVGFLVKDGDTSVLVSAIRRVAAGGTAWPA